MSEPLRRKCCAEQREMSCKGVQSLRMKVTRGNENRRYTVLLGSKHCKRCKPCFKKAPVGVNKLNSLTKTMAQRAGLGPKFKNHSNRKAMIQNLVTLPEIWDNMAVARAH